MLKAIHKNHEATQASSLYCVWTTRDGKLGSPLVAVWIDSRMGGFEKEFAADAGDAVELSADEPGGQALLCMSLRVGGETNEREA